MPRARLRGGGARDVVKARVGRWIGASSAETLQRLVLLSGTTAYLARVLDPGDFGASALLLSVVTTASVFVGLPYEEALAQRRVLRAAHLRAALAASLAAGIVLILLSVPFGVALGHWYGRADLALMLPVTALLLLAQAPLSIATAYARRRRAFSALSLSSVLAHVAGCGVAVVIAACGGGAWALVALRVVVVAINAFSLLAILRLWILPRWSWARTQELNRFAGFILLSRLIDNTTYLVFNMMTGSLYGLLVLGYANVALRLIEPLRGAVTAVTHNVCFALFVGALRGQVPLAQHVCRISGAMAAVLAPVFLGIAALSPILIRLIAGPDWIAAAPIAAALAAGGMVALSAQVIHTALSASGRPQDVLRSNTVGFLAMVTTLAAAAGLGPVGIGAARFAGDFAQVATTIVMGRRILGANRGQLLRRLTGSWLAGGLMAAAVLLMERPLQGAVGPIGALPILIVGGALVYTILLRVLAPTDWAELMSALHPALARLRSRTGARRDAVRADASGALLGMPQEGA